jgi:hypothetical protein
MKNIESNILFEKGYHGAVELKPYFDEYFSLISINSYGDNRESVMPYDIVTFRSDAWRSDTVSLFLDYCIYSNISFNKIKRMSSWYYIDAIHVVNKLDIDILTETAAFNNFLKLSFINKLNANKLYYSHYGEDNELNNVALNTLFQFLIVKYDLKVSSIYERNMKNVSLYD